MNRAAGTLFPLLLALVPALTAADAPRAVRPLLFAEYGVWCPAGVHSSQPWLHGSDPESATNAATLADVYSLWVRYPEAGSGFVYLFAAGELGTHS